MDVGEDMLRRLEARVARPGTQFELFGGPRPAPAPVVQAAPAPSLRQLLQNPAQMDVFKDAPMRPTPGPRSPAPRPTVQQVATVGPNKAPIFRPTVPVRGPAAAPSAPAVLDAVQEGLDLRVPKATAGARQTMAGAEIRAGAARTAPSTFAQRIRASAAAAPQTVAGASTREAITRAGATPRFTELMKATTAAEPVGVPVRSILDVADDAAAPAGKAAGRLATAFPRLAQAARGAGSVMRVGGRVMPYAAVALGAYDVGRELADPQSSIRTSAGEILPAIKEDLQDGNYLRAAGTGVRKVGKLALNTGLTATGMRSIGDFLSGLVGAEDAPALAGGAEPTEEMNEAWRQQYAQAQANIAAARGEGAVPEAGSAAQAGVPNTVLSPFAQIAAAYPNMNLQQMLAMVQALPASSAASNAALAPSRGKDLIAEDVVGLLRQNLAELAASDLSPEEKQLERQSIIQQYIALVSPQAALYGGAPIPEE